MAPKDLGRPYPLVAEPIRRAAAAFARANLYGSGSAQWQMRVLSHRRPELDPIVVRLDEPAKHAKLDCANYVSATSSSAPGTMSRIGSSMKDWRLGSLLATSTPPTPGAFAVVSGPVSVVVRLLFRRSQADCRRPA